MAAARSLPAAAAAAEVGQPTRGQRTTGEAGRGAQFWSVKCLKWSIVTRAHAPPQAAHVQSFRGQMLPRLQQMEAADQGARPVPMLEDHEADPS